MIQAHLSLILAISFLKEISSKCQGKGMKVIITKVYHSMPTTPLPLIATAARVPGRHKKNE